MMLRTATVIALLGCVSATYYIIKGSTNYGSYVPLSSGYLSMQGLGGQFNGGYIKSGFRNSDKFMSSGNQNGAMEGYIQEMLSSGLYPQEFGGWNSLASGNGMESQGFGIGQGFRMNSQEFGGYPKFGKSGTGSIDVSFGSRRLMKGGY